MNLDITVNLMTVPETAKFLGITEQSVHQRIRLNKIPAIKASGKCWLMRRSDVEAWAQQRKENFR